MTQESPQEASKAIVSDEAVNGTIDSFTSLDASGDRRAMNDLARRLGKEQPALLQFAAKVKVAHGDTMGEAAVFYATLMWAMFEREVGKKLPRLLPANLTDAQRVIAEECERIEGLADRPIAERLSPGLLARQPHIAAKLQELMAEDVKEEALSVEAAEVIYGPTQAVVEAFDAALTGRRPGQNLAPIVREEPKVGRNDPCPCGSGKKYKRCHGSAAA